MLQPKDSSSAGNRGAGGYRVALIRGGPEDDSGPEMMDAALSVLKPLLSESGCPRVDFVEVEAGAHCARKYGNALPPESLQTIRDLRVVFKAPTAGAKSPGSAPVGVTIKKALNTYANVTPCRSYRGVKTALRPGIDMVMVRENTEGLPASIFFRPVPDVSCETRVITRSASQRIARVAFEMARSRRQRLTICAVEARIFEGDIIFIEACKELGKAYPEVHVDVRKPDALAGILVVNPESFDVVVAPNDWGFIISDEMVATTGSVGLGPRANLGDGAGLFEPIHGTAPGKAGKGTVNPISEVLAGKMMLEWLGSRHHDEAITRVGRLIGEAVAQVLDEGLVLTGDMGGKASTSEVAGAVLDRARTLLAQR
ncbi:MAG: isocitrate/isopropylmalate dehydrogenase family protein [Chloroflexi bacterium]|nr:isocitrate/isopropylmalate dehydrogenase family protein [Chloroflexota bacterium]